MTVLPGTLEGLSAANANALDLLTRHPDFKHVDAQSLRALVALGWERTFALGEALMRQGEHSGNLFILLTGRVQVQHEAAGGQRLVVAELGAGEPVGEVSALVDTEHHNSVIAQLDVRALEISIKHAVELLNQD
ncbi:MAG TPA: cyclic nucleotide-binding domain-containing protein, partial [Chloroflexota bacterium]|nr:cyclic nucleotide-binding domain-containing protein [Chloroflexota bacterium]